jgi:hypothetical protein
MELLEMTNREGHEFHSRRKNPTDQAACSRRGTSFLDCERGTFALRSPTIVYFDPDRIRMLSRGRECRVTARGESPVHHLSIYSASKDKLRKGSRAAFDRREIPRSA